MRWKALFFLKDQECNEETTREEKFGFKSRKCPPQIDEMKPFEDDLLAMIENVQFKEVTGSFQKTLKEDIKKIKDSKKMIIAADKTRNLYEMEKDQYEKLLRENITKNYKIAKKDAYNKINDEAKEIASDLNIEDRMETIAKKQAFVTLKDHKDNFQNNPTCRLINPAKSEMGKVSKKLIDQVNTELKSSKNVNQWKNTASVIKWFKNIPNKAKYTFIIFHIAEFYPSITEDLLQKAISFAKQFNTVSEQDNKIIMHARKSLLFDKKTPWTKKGDKGKFDVTMGSYDGAEVCELVGTCILNILAEKYGKNNVGLYRDDGLAVFENINGNQAEKIRKEIIKIFRNFGLKITLETNQRIVNFLDITLNVTNGKYYPYRKPNDQPLYINTQSNHPPTIIKHLPTAISKRISSISYDQDEFKKAAPLYEEALKKCGYNENLIYSENSGARTKSRKNRKRNIIWFNPPFRKSVRTNIGHTFLRPLNKHLQKHSKLHKIFNKNNVKVSYSCMENMACIIKSHNKNITTETAENATKGCNCRDKENCPLKGNCQETSIIYNAKVTPKNDTNKSNTYIGLTELAFKKRFSSHMNSIRHRKYENSTELSKHIWSLKDRNQEYDITWSITNHATPYSNETKRCNLCLTEKLCIMKANKSSLLNKRSELISKCRHENKYYLTNFK